MPTRWQRHKDSDGKDFFFNRDTKESKWSLDAEEEEEEGEEIDEDSAYEYESEDEEGDPEDDNFDDFDVDEQGDMEIQEELAALPLSTILEVSTKAYTDLSARFSDEEAKSKLLTEANQKLRNQLLNQHLYRQAFVRWKIAAEIGISSNNGGFFAGALFGAISTFLLCLSMMAALPAIIAAVVIVVTAIIGSNMQNP